MASRLRSFRAEPFGGIMPQGDPIMAKHQGKASGTAPRSKAKEKEPASKAKAAPLSLPERSKRRSEKDDSIPRFWSLFDISEIRREPLSIGGKLFERPAAPERIVRNKAGAYFGIASNGKRSAQFPIAHWAPAHSAFWQYRKGNPIRLKALDGCGLDAAKDRCQHDLPSFIAALGWLDAAKKHPAAKRTPAPKAKAKAKKAKATSKAKAKKAA
jgi:hypothetical protein